MEPAGQGPSTELHLQPEPVLRQPVSLQPHAIDQFKARKPKSPITYKFPWSEYHSVLEKRLQQQEGENRDRHEALDAERAQHDLTPAWHLKTQTHNYCMHVHTK